MGKAKKIEVDNLIEKQYEAECAFMQDFEQNEYTFENPKVVVNPYLINPCAALIMFRTPKPVKVTVCVKGKTAALDLAHTYGRSTEHILPVLGLYDDYENTVEIRLYQGKSREIKIRTAGHPMNNFRVVSMTAKPEHLNGDLVMLVPAMIGFPTAVDAAGDVRWYFSENMMFAGKKLANGHFMIGTERKQYTPYYSTGVYEMDMIGKIYKEYRIPGLYHHEHVEMENGDLILLSDDFSSDSIEDIVVIVDRETGEVKKRIDCKDFLPRGEAMSGCGTMWDWFHNNAAAYDDQNNSLILSGRHMDAIVSYSLDTEQINWIIGDPETWPGDMQHLFFTPAGSGDFDWQYEQHGVVITPDGDIMCFDNGHWRAKRKENYRRNIDTFSRGVRFRLNLEEKTIEQIWQYGKERGSEFFSTYISNVEYYGEGHYLVHSGGIQRVNGVTTEEVLPPNKWSEGEVISDTVEIYGEEVLWELKVRSNYFRGTKVSLYADGDNLTLGQGIQLGHLAETPCVLDQPFEKSGEPLPGDVMLHIIDETDFFLLKGRFEDNVKAYLYLAGEKETRAYRIKTIPNKYDAVSCMPYIPADPRNKSESFSKEGLAGSYHVYISLEERYYDTGLTLRAK